MIKKLFLAHFPPEWDSLMNKFSHERGTMDGNHAIHVVVLELSSRIEEVSMRLNRPHIVQRR